MEPKSIGFIGGGRITKIFLKAFDNKQVKFSQIIVSDTNIFTLNSLKDQFPTIQITDNIELAAKQDILFIALHPPVINETITAIKHVIAKNSIVISLAPKITNEKIANILGINNIARMIPNATSYINQGYNPMCFAPSFSDDQRRSILELLKHLGHTFEVEESKLESYAILSAMLPTYFWFQWEEMQNIGLQMGLNESECKETIHETLKAAINLLYTSDLNSTEVMDLIPIKPIAEHEPSIKEYLSAKLIPLFEKIKP